MGSRSQGPGHGELGGLRCYCSCLCCWPMRVMRVVKGSLCCQHTRTEHLWVPELCQAREV